MPRIYPRTTYYYMARPGQYFFLDEFLTPTAYPIQQIAGLIKGEQLSEVGPQAFELGPGKVVYTMDSKQFGVDEYFQFPFETLKHGRGDCEDESYLLASILLACGLLGTEVVLGTLVLGNKRYGHVWVEVGGVAIEATAPKWNTIPDPKEMGYFGEWRVGFGFVMQAGPLMAYQLVKPVAFGTNPEETQVLKRTLPKLDEEEHKELMEKLELFKVE